MTEYAENGIHLFPAHAGMNRPLGGTRTERYPVPRTRGDEPTAAISPLITIRCSPHTRG